MATTDQLIKTVFNKTFKKKTYEELCIGKLAHVDFKDTIDMGDTIEVLLPGNVTLFPSDGNTLTGNAEEVQVATTQIKVDHCEAVFFTMNDAKKQQIENAPTDDAKIDLIAEYSNDAVKKFAAKIDEEYGKLYARAGMTISDSAVTLSSANISKFFALMNAKFKRGDKMGHTSWVQNKMLAIIPPEMTAVLTGMTDLQYVESRAKEIVNGYVGRLQGWDIIESNNIYSYEDDGQVYYQPLFGQQGATLAGGVQSTFKLIDNIPDKGFNTEYKGKGVFGVGAPRADLFGTQTVKLSISL